MPIDAATFRRAVAHVPTAVSVVTTLDARGRPWGATVGSLCALSVTPPLVMFCLEKGNASHELLTSTPGFLVHVLRDDQRDIAAWFARRGDHSFGGPYMTAYGLPSIQGTLARLSCVRYALIPGGDHTIVVGLVEVAGTQAGRPLLYFSREYFTTAPVEPANRNGGNGPGNSQHQHAHEGLTRSDRIAGLGTGLDPQLNGHGK